ncbi:MAG: hypothetical protein ACXV8Q_03435 [Methylobacter sp.]
MSLLFFDGFDGYDAVGDLTAFGGWASTNAQTSISSAVRTGAGKSAALINSSTGQMDKLLPEQSGKTLYLGFAFCNTTAANSSQILRVSNSAGATQIKLHVNSTNKLEVQNASGTILKAGTTTLLTNVWYYVELKILVASSGGICDCKLGGVSEFTFLGNTQSQATNSVMHVAFDNFGSMGTYLVDDLYILNSDGSANNTYLGEQRCEIITPTSDSAVAWTRNTGTSNWDAVNDAIGAPDDDTTYVSSSTTTQRDEYGLSDLSGVNAVAGVKLVTRAKKDDVNPRSFKHGIKSGATDQQVTYALGVGYGNYIDIFETSDGAGTAFTATTVNSLLSTLEVV